MIPLLALAGFERPVGDVAQNITVFAIAYGLMQLVYGPLGDRHGALRVIGLFLVAGTFTTKAWIHN